MFTGIVESSARSSRVEQLEGDAARLTVRGRRRRRRVRPGDSIAVNGVCLTVTGFAGTGPGARAPVRRDGGDAAPLDARRRSPPATAVNLERALRVGDRLGGHVVQGHVDGTARILERRPGEQLGDRADRRCRRHWPATSWRRARSRSTACSLTVAAVGRRLVHRRPHPGDAAGDHAGQQAGGRAASTWRSTCSPSTWSGCSTAPKGEGARSR